MIEASAKVDELEKQKYPDGDGSEIVYEFRKREYPLKKLQEAIEILEREKVERANVTAPDPRLARDRPPGQGNVIGASYPV